MTKHFAILFICILGAALVKSELDKTKLMKEFMENSEKCMTETGATKADIEALVKKLPAATKEGKCMRACLMKKYGVMNADGKFDKAVAMEHGKFLADGDVEKTKIAAEIVDACAGLAVPDDPCEATDVYGKCFMEQAKKHGIDKLEI